MGGAYADRTPGWFRGRATHRMGDPMSHRHDPVRVSRRTALGAAAAAGAALGSGKHALAASSDPSGPTTDPNFVAQGTDFAEVAPAPTTPGTRYISLAGIDWACLQATATFCPTEELRIYSAWLGSAMSLAGWSVPSTAALRTTA